MGAWNEYSTNGHHVKEATIGTITKVWVDELNKAFGNSDKWAMIKNRTNTQPPKANNEDMRFEDLFFINYKFMYIPFEMRMWLYENCGHYKDFAQTGEEHEWIPAFTEEMFEKKHRDAISVLKQYKKDSTRRKISDKARRVIFMVVATIIVIAVSIPSMIEASETTYKETMNETIHERNIERTQARLEADPTSVHVKMDELDISRFFDDCAYGYWGTYYKCVEELFYTDHIPTSDELMSKLERQAKKDDSYYHRFVIELGYSEDKIPYTYGERIYMVDVYKFVKNYHPERAEEILANLEYTEAI